MNYLLADNNITSLPLIGETCKTTPRIGSFSTAQLITKEF